MWWTKRLMILLGIIPAFAVAFVVAPAPVQASAAETGGVIVARPATIDFHKKFAGTHTYKRTKITNTGQTTVRLLIADYLKDDFGFGGSGEATTCPYGDFLMAPGASCYVVIHFAPVHVDPGHRDSRLEVTAYDPTSDPTTDFRTWVVIDELLIPIHGETVCRYGLAPEGYCL